MTTNRKRQEREHEQLVRDAGEMIKRMRSSDATAAASKRNYNGDTALHLAVFDNNEHAIETLLLRDVVDVNKKNVYGYTALHLAVKLNAPNIVEALVTADTRAVVDVNAKSDNGETPLYLAQRQWQQQPSDDLKRILMLLFKCKTIEVNNKHVANNLYPLHMQVMSCCCCDDDDCDEQELLECMLKHIRGIDINVCDVEYRNSALHIAIHKENKNAFNTIIRTCNDIDINIKNRHGLCALHMAVLVKDQRLRVYFIDELLAMHRHRIDPNIRENEYGYTPLMTALELQRWHAAQTLINDNRVDTSICDNFGNTPMHKMIVVTTTTLASSTRRIHIFEKLFARNNNDTLLQTKNRRGETPFDVAIKERNIDLVDMIIDKSQSIGKIERVKKDLEEAREDRLSARGVLNVLEKYS